MIYEQEKSNINIASVIYEKRCIHIVSIAIFILGVINILSAWLSLDYSRLRVLKNLFEYQWIIGSRYLVVITGIMSLLVAPALYRQKRIAWYLSVLLLSLSGFAHIVKGADIEEASLCVLLLGMLIPLYKYCYVKSDPAKTQHGGWIFLAAIFFVISYTFIGVHVFAHKLNLNPDDISTWKLILNSFMFDTSGFHPVGLRAKFFVNSLLAINSFAMLIGVSLALSPVIVRNLPDVNYDRFKAIANKYASQPVQNYTINKDYQHFYLKNEVGEGLISYKVSNRVAVAIGNPCGDISISEITEKWIKHVLEYDWIPAAYQADGEFLEILKSFGFNIVPVGVEALVKLSDFTLAGKAMQSLRTAKNKADREGWYIRKYTYQDWEKVKKLDTKWLNIHGKSENTFAMGKSSPKYLAETNTMLLLDKEDNLLAYVNNIELAGVNARSIDLMRRDPDSPQGVMDQLILNQILTAKDSNLEFYDLGFSPLAKIDESISDNKVVVKLFKLIFEKQRKYYDFQGLYNFKSKFVPKWKTSYLVFPNRIKLPNVLLALLNLNQGK